MRRGYVVISLLLLSLLLVICLGLLLRQPMGYAQATARQDGLQARWLAEAGVDHVRVQFMNDGVAWRNHETAPVSYLEQVEAVGHFRVTLDRRWEGPPYSLLRIESEGMVGSPSQPRARYVVEAVLDLLPVQRNGSGNPNPDYFQWIEWNERLP